MQLSLVYDRECCGSLVNIQYFFLQICSIISSPVYHLASESFQIPLPRDVLLSLLSMEPSFFRKEVNK